MAGASKIGSLTGRIRLVDREDDATASEISLALSAGKTLIATLSRREADALALSVGDGLFAVIDPSNVLLAVD